MSDGTEKGSGERGRSRKDRGPGGLPAPDGVLDRALVLVEYLRTHCPWDRKQTARSLVPHLLEETHETVEAIHAGSSEALRGELGDLLLNLAFQIVVAEEEGAFDREQVVRSLEEKMIRRHPHLFGKGDPESWEAIKSRERKAAALDSGEAVPPGALAGLPRGLDPLLRAHRMQERAAGVGFDWDEARGALEKVREELAEVEEILAEIAARGTGGERDRGRRVAPPKLQEEMGDLLFSVVNLARLAGAHAVPSLEGANVKFRRRFEALEALGRERGVPIPGASLGELDALWEEVKAGE